MHPFQEFLTHRLTQPLPGQEAQNLMRPKVAYAGIIPDPETVRNSAVLVPIITWKDQLEIILTLRTAGIKHGGQISFPGGGMEGDETHAETALRESHEEIGLIEAHVSVTGSLSNLYVDRSNNMVTPIVGFIDEEQEFQRNPNEVDEIFSVPISELLNGENHNWEEWEIRDRKIEVPFWSIHKVPLWGATAMMLSELLELYKEFVQLSIKN